jgi:hypothetical protein
MLWSRERRDVPGAAVRITAAERLNSTQNGHPYRNRQRSRMTVTRVETIAARPWVAVMSSRRPPCAGPTGKARTARGCVKPRAPAPRQGQSPAAAPRSLGRRVAGGENAMWVWEAWILLGCEEQLRFGVIETPVAEIRTAEIRARLAVCCAARGCVIKVSC